VSLPVTWSIRSNPQGAKSWLATVLGSTKETVASFSMKEMFGFLDKAANCFSVSLAITPLKTFWNLGPTPAFIAPIPRISLSMLAAGLKTMM
jgi:hypothetical protein